MSVLPEFTEPAIEGGRIRAEGVVKAVLHFDADARRGVYRVLDSEERSIVVDGRGDPLAVGDRLTADGKTVLDVRHGERFLATSIRGDFDATPEGVVRFLAAGAVRGCDRRTGERLAAFFGERLPEVMNSSATLTSARIPADKARRISAAWRLRVTNGPLLSLLQCHGVPNSVAERIVELKGSDALRAIRTDPYELAERIPGLGFPTADRIALSQGRAKVDPERVRAAIVHELAGIAREGHCAALTESLSVSAAAIADVPRAVIDAGVAALTEEGELVAALIGGREVLYERRVLGAEEDVAALIAARVRKDDPPSGDPRLVAESARVRLGVPPLHEGQEEAVLLGLRSSLCVITGGPGTGKTSTVSVLVEALRERFPDARVALAAPTGRAAQKMAESAGHPASTIHRLLEFDPVGKGFLRGPSNPLEVDILVVDEGSMLDLRLARDLLRALPASARLVIVGDVDQLPSVGAGNVLRDVIDSGVVPVARLVHVFRQGAGSAIAVAASRINAGVMPRLDPLDRTTGDLRGVFRETPEEVAASLEEFVRLRLPRLLLAQNDPSSRIDPLRDFQVLTSGHKGETGTTALNRTLQSLLNPALPGEPELDLGERVFRPRDRVIQIVNDYDREVFNGDIGRVEAVLVEEGEESEADGLVVVFPGDRIVTYGRAELDQLRHAYCISIHKSQGSEFPVVAVVLTTQHWTMMRRNLAYTGVSRARRLCLVFAQERALRHAVRNASGGRLTGLAKRIRDAVVVTAA